MIPKRTGEITARQAARRLAAAYVRLGVIGVLGVAALVGGRPGASDDARQRAASKPEMLRRKASLPAPPSAPALPAPPRLPGIG